MGIKIISLNVLDDLYQGVDPYSKEGVALFKGYIQDNEIFFYSALRKEFSTAAAFQQAKAEGFTKLMMEDMS